jgi:hypothetical protein
MMTPLYQLGIEKIMPDENVNINLQYLAGAYFY